MQKKDKNLALTFTLILYLAEQLLKQLKFCIYLNNLFLNLSVAQCLLIINIYCMNIIHKKTKDVSLSLQRYLDNNSKLLWDSIIAEIINGNTVGFI